MQCKTDTGITDYTSSALFCVARRLAINQYTYWEVGILKLEAYCMFRRILIRSAMKYYLQ